jgi:hypothetical protein
MLSKIFASWLVALIIVPFTAPFSTCDIASFVGGASAHAPHAPGSDPSSVTPANEAVVPGVLFVSAAGRVRPLPLSSIAAVDSPARASSATAAGPMRPVAFMRVHLALRTVIRV